MAVLTIAPESQFIYVIVAARRARQLMAGARPLVDNPRSRKATRIAQEELDTGVLEYEVPEVPESPEEKEGKRRRG
jgi:DNA-directed RNA polymerase subunit omega